MPDECKASDSANTFPAMSTGEMSYERTKFLELQELQELQELRARARLWVRFQWPGFPREGSLLFYVNIDFGLGRNRQVDSERGRVASALKPVGHLFPIGEVAGTKDGIGSVRFGIPRDHN